MDISSFATKANADEGKWFPVKIEGVKVPLALKLYGSDSDLVKNFERNKIRKLALVKTKKEIDEETLDEFMENEDEAVVIRIAEVSSYDWKKRENTSEPVILNGKTIENNEKSFAYLIEAFPALREFIVEKSNARANFLD